jgi:hypothetical protein
METNFKFTSHEEQYIDAFQKALENLTLVCNEYKGTPMCKKRRRKINKLKSIL